ncbi:hypothetical protein A3733_23455 [Pseudoalteromonas shioyasakiensis]|nr:hypothetical protein A3733_23455 [Pseudoalteromonas shioyasakiensis]
MSENITSALEILNDADILITELEKDISDFFALSPYKIVVEHNVKTGYDTHKIKLISEIPGQFRSKVRHIASDIRSSLDHVAYSAAIATGKKKPRNTYFPFAKNESEASNIRKNKCRDLPEEIFNVFWSFKPYNGGNNTLYGLNEIANCNKHRSVVPVGHGLSGGQMMIKFSCDGKCHSIGIPPVWDSVKNEVTLCVVDSAANTSYDIQLGFDICFGDIEILKGQSVLHVLKNLLELSKSIIHTANDEGMRIGIFK